jgi:hypothetical protein
MFPSSRRTRSPSTALGAAIRRIARRLGRVVILAGVDHDRGEAVVTVGRPADSDSLDCGGTLPPSQTSRRARPGTYFCDARVGCESHLANIQQEVSDAPR